MDECVKQSAPFLSKSKTNNFLREKAIRFSVQQKNLAWKTAAH